MSRPRGRDVSASLSDHLCCSKQNAERRSKCGLRTPSAAISKWRGQCEQREDATPIAFPAHPQWQQKSGSDSPRSLMQTEAIGLRENRLDANLRLVSGRSNGTTL